MKPLPQFLLMLGGAATLTGCAKDPAPAPTTDCVHRATIIGLAPCGNRGFTLALDSPRDTVVTYNLPAGLFTLTAATPFSGKNDQLFAPSAFVKIKAGYQEVALADRTTVFCNGPGPWGNPSFDRMTKGKEVRIVCATTAN